jgi:hypothetical protein
VKGSLTSYGKNNCCDRNIPSASTWGRWGKAENSRCQETNKRAVGWPYQEDRLLQIKLLSTTFDDTRLEGDDSCLKATSKREASDQGRMDIPFRWHHRTTSEQRSRVSHDSDLLNHFSARLSLDSPHLAVNVGSAAFGSDSWDSHRPSRSEDHQQTSWHRSQ